MVRIPRWDLAGSAGLSAHWRPPRPVMGGYPGQTRPGCRHRTPFVWPAPAGSVAWPDDGIPVRACGRGHPRRRVYCPAHTLLDGGSRHTTSYHLVRIKEYGKGGPYGKVFLTLAD